MDVTPKPLSGYRPMHHEMPRLLLAAFAGASGSSLAHLVSHSWIVAAHFLGIGVSPSEWAWVALIGAGIGILGLAVSVSGGAHAYLTTSMVSLSAAFVVVLLLNAVASSLSFLG